MSGVFGIVDPHQHLSASDQFQRMATALKREARQVVEGHQAAEPNLALGRVGIGVFNRDPQPVWNAARTVAVFLAGELYVAEGAEVGEGDGPADEQRLLDLYARHGVDFPRHVQGAYVCAVWDAGRGRVIVANDHFALYPTFYARPAGRLVFAPEVKGVLTDPGVDRALRPDAIAEYARFQHVLGFKTFLAGVHLLPPASVLVFDLASATHTLTTYWDLTAAPQTPLSMPFEDAVAEATRLFRRSVARRTRGPARLGVFLSGGLDGRSILGLIPSARQPVHTFTFGLPGCRDEVYARQIAAAADAQHHYYPYTDGKWILDWVDRHVALTEGFHPWYHMHGIQAPPDASQHVDVNLSGLGDLLWTQDNFAPLALVEAPDDTAFRALLFDLYTAKYTWPGLTEGEARTLFHPEGLGRYDDLAYESFKRELAAYEHLPPHLRLAAFNQVNHFLRYILHSAILARPHLEARFPYFDLDLYVFCHSLAHAVGDDRAIQKALIINEMPALARVPTTDDELALTNGHRAHVTAKAAQKLRRAIHRVLPPLFPTHGTLYADYENWLRTDLRAWAEGILFDERTLARGLFAPAALRSLMDRHLAGHEHPTLGKIAHFITLELALRQMQL